MFLFSARAYAPGEYKVLVSSDGGNFEEAACWRSSSRTEVSYQETVLFKNIQSAETVAIVMKAPMPWGYFGLNDVRLLTEGDEAFMIVTGSPSHNLEECLVVSGRGVSAQTCLDAVAGGDGRDVFKFAGENLIHAASGMCVAFTRGAGNQLSLQDCAVAERAQDGRASWELTAEGQIKLMRMGNYCLSVASGRAVVGDCGDSLQKFAFVVVPEMALNSVVLAQDQALLLAAAAKRQRSALNDLQTQISSLGVCKFAISLFKLPENCTKGVAAHSSEQSLAMQKANGQLDGAVHAIGRIYSAMGVDMANVMQLIGESSHVLEAAQAKLSLSA